MKGIVFDAFGGPEVLRLADPPLPELRPGDLLVRVRAAGVNRADLLQRQGAYAGQHFGDSPLLGLELAGEVVAVGADVTGFAPGDRVMAITGGGAYADHARVDQAMALPVPAGMGMSEAAAVMESFVTAWEAAAHLASVAPGQRLMVTAAAGGVGSAVVQIGRALGAQVLATARPHHADPLRALGAQEVIDDRAADPGAVAAQMARFAGDPGLDAIVDFIGGGTLARNLGLLRPGGTLVQVGLMAGTVPVPMPLNLLLHNHLRLLGTVMKSRSPDEKRAMVQRFARGGLPLFATHALRPVIARVFPLAEARAAHEAMAAGGSFGKIVLTME
ncbi:zinc-binding dehydrogenase [Pseudooceanicola sp. GBMRC 2024]|uniref:Zinc-binding dehydrogenase n=1 Tax=Pseudooceanicola albus TaxID=2692189 RepID=A0A6L7G2S8_9RHOB|nr:zinc-binding dehydrogenase [Pseudooceanicola albus]MXN17757.1 zinc-binding dehydrogenase [Pseudooceanicola albus]